MQSPFENFPDAAPGERVDLASVAETMLETWHNDRTFFGLLRTAASDEDAANLMREFFEKRVRPHQSRVTGLPPDEAVLFGSMLAGIAFAKTSFASSSVLPSRPDSNPTWRKIRGSRQRSPRFYANNKATLLKLCAVAKLC